MRKLIAHKHSLTKTIAIAIAALGMTALPVQPAQAQTRDASVQIADAPREPVRSCYDYAADIYETWGWFEAAGAYVDCITNPNHPDNDDDERPSTTPGGSTDLADAPREPSRSCYDHAYEVYLTSGWWEAAAAYLNCDGNANHPDNDEKP